MKILEVVTPLSIYHGCSSQKRLCKGNFTPVNMKNCVCLNVRKHREINNGENYITLYISLYFGIMDNMKIKSSEKNIIWEDQERG